MSKWSPTQIRCSWCWTWLVWAIEDLQVAAAEFYVECPECGYECDVQRNNVPSMWREAALERLREGK